MELLFLQWSEHLRKLGNFLRTKAEPLIFYMFAKPMDEDTKLVEQRNEETFGGWKAARREKLTQYLKQVEQYMANVEKNMEKCQNARKARKIYNDMLNLQGTMDKELETYRLEHGPKTRKIPSGANNEDEDDVEQSKSATMLAAQSIQLGINDVGLKAWKAQTYRHKVIVAGGMESMNI